MNKIKETITSNVYKIHSSVYQFTKSITIDCNESFESVEGRTVMAFIDSINSWEYAIQKLVSALENQQRDSERVITQIKDGFQPFFSTADWRIEEYKSEHKTHESAIVQLCYIIGIDAQTRIDLFKLITELTFANKGETK
jgi:hypothetical protein